ncbi:MAG: hypothetical protein BECKG1743D_GA0114223_104814 [Candidatus Kentron sp. G]|nr:MAG: hypothetical protein BECKG1743F_GA0114225_104634 [Candidatus Kentron sp. G]VFN02856.1 MAG: hypothetical protein BECKG1743E_GA0114224_105512 [Candidatus Kentron sp. G]VFN03502.1 MAG: hypothetical protein BECKG1743D_GA0114223_104814 [Candidatus Kentron sp. G]
MAIYAIIVSENADVVRNKLSDNYTAREYHEPDPKDGYFFVSDPALIDVVAEKAGFGEYEGPEDKRPKGFVLKYEHIRGYYRMSLWEWFDDIKRSV